MTIEVSWGNEAHTIIVWRMPRSFIWDDYDDASRCSRALAESVSYPVCSIFDLSAITALPEGTLANLPRIAQDTPDNVRVTFVVGAKGFAGTMGRIFSKVYGRVNFVDTIAEAVSQAEAYLLKKAG